MPYRIVGQGVVFLRLKNGKNRIYIHYSFYFLTHHPMLNTKKFALWF